MARYRASVDTTLSPKKVFDYLSDFSTTEQWDPGVVSAERIGAGPIGDGTQFHLVASFMGRDNELTYTVVEYEPHTAVTVRGENATVVSLDRITFEPREGGGTTVTYDADLRLKSVLRIFDPLLAIAFRRVGDRALAGLTQTLVARQHTPSSRRRNERGPALAGPRTSS